MAGEVATKIAATGEKIAQAGWERRFGVIFGSLADSIKTIHELGFVVYIASFQLAKKSQVIW